MNEIIYFARIALASALGIAVVATLIDTAMTMVDGESHLWKLPPFAKINRVISRGNLFLSVIFRVTLFIVTFALFVAISIPILYEPFTPVSAQSTTDDDTNVSVVIQSESTDYESLTGTQYIAVINVKQSHFSLNIGDMIKDEMNDVDIEIPVSKEFYDAISIGDELNDDFRLGSFVMNGSVGSWDITISDKYVIEE